MSAPVFELLRLEVLGSAAGAGAAAAATGAAGAALAAPSWLVAVGQSAVVVLFTARAVRAELRDLRSAHAALEGRVAELETSPRR